MRAEAISLSLVGVLLIGHIIYQMISSNAKRIERIFRFVLLSLLDPPAQIGWKNSVQPPALGR